MKKNFKWLLALVAMVASVNLMAGVTDLSESLDLTTKTKGQSAYNTSTVYGDWTIVNGANNNKGWAYFKMGGKEETLKSYNPCYIYYSAASGVSSQVDSITVSIAAGSLSKANMSVNSWGVYVYSDKDMKTQIDYVAGGTITKNAATFGFKPTAGVTWAAGSYYKVSWDLANTTSTNGIVCVDKVTLHSISDTPDPVLQSIAISGTPKTAYETGESFDVTGLTVIGTYDIGDPQDLTIDAEWEITPATFTSTSQTSVSVTAKVGEKSDTKNYNVTVTEHVVTPGTYEIALNKDLYGIATAGNVAAEQSAEAHDITVVSGCTSSAGTKTYYDAAHIRYYADSYLKLSVPNGYEITSVVFTADGTWNGSITSTPDTYEANTKTWTGRSQNVDFAFAAQNRAASIKVTFEVKKVLSGIAVKTAPTITTYAVGEFFNPAGLVITATYDNADPTDIAYENNEDKFSFSPALDAALETTDEQVTITYGGKSCNQAITVKNIELTSIVVSGNLSKTEYTEGDDFDFTGLVATGYYSDESNKDITDQVNWSIDPATLSAGQTSVSVIATSGLISGNKSYNITVNEAPKIATFSGDASADVTFATGSNSKEGAIWEGSPCAKDVITLTGAVTSGSNYTYYDGTVVRFYTNNNLVLTPASGYEITKVEIVRQSTTGNNTGTINCVGLTADEKNTTTNTNIFTGSAKGGVTFTVSAQARFKSITVHYAIAAPSAATPTITPSTEAEVYWEPITVTLACETEGADIYYTTNGDVPTVASTLYEAPFQVSATTTVKAIAVKEGLDNSEVASKIFSFGKVFDNIAACLADETLQNGDVVKISNVSAVITSFAGSGKTVYFEGGSFYVNATYPQTYAIGGTLSGSNLQFTYMNYNPKQLRPASWEALTYTAPGSPTGVNNVKANAKATKAIVNGQIVIVRDNKTYNVLGF